ncbi:hypothetical protein BDW02DRAFT_566606 [Decorospora gaudefroyi]|uniref:Uncharacterized protein n=1 Tax=Decorospora gaudefroyi TaxID=184978 RepID=A0A6A5KL49_9PLEO|nr:hypothetical protein BDW02DRAFT_566606 [Decorospora gaudefroyi]
MPVFPADELAHQSGSLQHTRAASSGDYFSQTPARRTAHHSRRLSPLATSSGPSSDSSTRVRSPLSQVFQPNPETTFDSFLQPHKSGKGEAFRNAENAKKPKTSPEGSLKGKRLSKMPSMPLLSKRTAQREASSEGE